MKLYAITTSERASKGQGGNEYLQIQLSDENKVIFGSIAVLPDKRVYGSIHGHKIDIELKGNKKKDEYECTGCGATQQSYKGLCNSCRGGNIE